MLSVEHQRLIVGWLCRYHDAEYAKEKWGTEELLCCPIPLSLPAAVARQSSPEAPNPMRDVLGVVTLGLAAGTAATGRCGCE